MTTFRTAPPIGGAEEITVRPGNASTSLHSEFSMAMHRIAIYISMDSFAASPGVAYGGDARLLVADLGWSREEAAAVRAQLAAFEEGWDAPEMHAYDAL